MRRILVAVFLFSPLAAATSPLAAQPGEIRVEIVDETAKVAPPDPIATDRPPRRVRNIILLIGDGMGPQQLGLLELYLNNCSRMRKNYPMSTW